MDVLTQLHFPCPFFSVGARLRRRPWAAIYRRRDKVPTKDEAKGPVKEDVDLLANSLESFGRFTLGTDKSILNDVDDMDLALMASHTIDLEQSIFAR
jgi:hypothetical protein